MCTRCAKRGYTDKHVESYECSKCEKTWGRGKFDEKLLYHITKEKRETPLVCEYWVVWLLVIVVMTVMTVLVLQMVQL